MQRDQMLTRDQAERIAFEIYLRTGRIVTFEALGNPQVKFNPWHDTENGRFTFAGQGVYFGSGAPDYRNIESVSTLRRRGGEAASSTRRRDALKPRGGSFGGGGASGSWSEASAPGGKRTTPKPPVRPVTARPGPPSRIPPKHSLLPVLDDSPAIHRIEKNGYSFDVSSKTGPDRRTQRVSGELRLEASKRSRRAQSQAGGADRNRPTTVGTSLPPDSTALTIGSTISRRIRISTGEPIAP